MSRKLIWFIFSFAILMLTGCAHRSINTDHCRVLLFQQQLADDLRGDGIQIVTVGDEVTLILPTAKFFYSNSNHMRDKEGMLNRITAFINTFPVVDIRVKGYTDNRGNYTRNMALSRAQAQAIATYMWGHGLNSRLISAEGYGCHNPYGFNHIEIFFRLPRPDNIFH